MKKQFESMFKCISTIEKGTITGAVLSKNKIVIFGTTCLISSKTENDFNIEDSVLVDPHTMMKILSALEDDAISFILKESNLLVKQKKFSAKVPILEQNIPEEIEIKNSITIDQPAWDEIINAATFTQSSKETFLPELCYVALTNEGIYSSNRISIYNSKNFNVPISCFLLHSDTVNGVSNLKETPKKIYYNEEMQKIKTENYAIQIPNTSHEYPKERLDQLFTDTYENSIEVDTDAFKKTIEKLALFGDTFDFSILDNKAILCGELQTKFVIPITLNGEKTSFIVHTQEIKKIIDFIKTNKIYFNADKLFVEENGIRCCTVLSTKEQ